MATKSTQNPLSVAVALAEVYPSSASLVKKVLADAAALQAAGEPAAAVEKLRSLAILVEGIDDTLAAHAWSQAGSVLSGAGKYAEAVVAYGDVIRLQPECGEAYLHRGTARNELEQYKAALADLERALCLSPDVASAIYSARGVAKSGLGQHEAARAEHEQAFRLEPRCAVLYANRGFSQMLQGADEAAIADFDEALRLNPEMPEVYHYRGEVKFFRGQYESSIADYDAAIRLEPKNAVYYTNRGLTKTSLGENDAAFVDYEEAIRIDPELAQPYTFRAEEKLRLGRDAAAKVDLKKALKLARVADDATHQSYIEYKLKELEQSEEDSN